MATNKDSTSTDLPVTAPEVTKAQADAFDLDPHLINLMWDEPFFSKVLRTVTKVRTEDIPTAGVLARDGDVNMWWNPYFLAGLTSKQVKGLLKHECFHLVFEHTTTRRMEPHTLHSYATDLAINSMIPGDELPEGGLVPGQAFKPLTPEVIAKIGPAAHARYERISQKIASLPMGLSAEQYFALLQDVAEDIEKAGKGKSLAQAIKDGDLQVGPNGELTDRDGNPVAIVPGGMDHHDGWDEMDESERELIKGKVQQALERAVRESDSMNTWGTVGAETRAALRALLAKEIDWRSVLKQFCGSTRRADRANNVKRLNRKYPGLHPGTQHNYTSSIAVYIDQSGSVDDDNLELLFSNLMSLAKRTEFTLFNFDTAVDLKSERVWKKGKTPGVSRTRCGGTDFRAPTRHANENKHRFDGYLILTDGEASDPGPSQVKRGWVIVPDRKMLFEASGRDVVIRMKRGQTVGVGNAA
jgi:predicted metal-dependent peptidase